MSSSKLALSSSVTNFDFSTADSQAYGAQPMEDLPGSLFGLRGGDGDKNGSISAFDFLNVWLIENGGGIGYHAGDFNMDGSVTAFDFLNIWLSSNGQITQIP